MNLAVQEEAFLFLCDSVTGKCLYFPACISQQRDFSCYFKNCTFSLKIKYFRFRLLQENYEEVKYVFIFIQVLLLIFESIQFIQGLRFPKAQSFVLKSCLTTPHTKIFLIILKNLTGSLESFSSSSNRNLFFRQKFLQS